MVEKKLKRGRESGVGKREGRRAKAGEISKWDGVVPAEQRARLGTQTVLGVLSKMSSKAVVSSCSASGGATWFWEGRGEKQAPLTPPGCFSYKGMPRLTWAESLSDSCRVWVNGRGPPRSTPAVFSRKESRHIKASKDGGEKKRRGEGLIPLCGRKYLPVKENELKVVGVGGEGRGELCRLLGERLSPSVGLICLQRSGERRGWGRWLIG